MGTLSFRNINKVYPNGFHAVKDFNLEVEDKEFIIFVGPSGCGKSTTLRMIAGLEEISAGELYIDGVLMNNRAPKDRDIAMVFQNYALYPHMTVKQNILFPLQNLKGVDKMSKDDMLERALVALVPSEGFGIDGYARLSYATSMETIIEGLNRIEKYINGEA